ncbi:MAG: GNAT family N-acetyltransferase [Clostridia bacterium]|nr:GNAT family N-acetyltransferase [Clostridia bacterium]
MNYVRMICENDIDIPRLSSILDLPEISRYISIDKTSYWHYVSSTENVYYFKAYEGGNLVGAIHCEVAGTVLYMDIMVFPEHQQKGVGTTILRDVQSGILPLPFDRIEVSIDETNLASIKLFEKAGFRFVSKEDELLNYVYVK